MLVFGVFLTPGSLTARKILAKSQKRKAGARLPFPSIFSGAKTLNFRGCKLFTIGFLGG